MESHKLKCTALMSTHLKFISVVGTLLLRQDRMDEAKTENNADILKEDEMKIVELIMTLPTRKRLLLCITLFNFSTTADHILLLFTNFNIYHQAPPSFLIKSN